MRWGERIAFGWGLALVSLATTACFGLGDGEPEAAVHVTGEPTWINGIQDLLVYYCGECHGAEPSDGSLAYFRVDVYDDDAGRSGAYSLRLRHLARVSDPARPMPPAPRRAMVPEEVAALERWVSNGAPYDETSPGPGEGVPACQVDTVGACACAGGYYGRQTCLPDGTYEPCDCSGGGGPGPGGDPPPDPVLDDVVAWVFEPSCSRGTTCHGPGRARPDLTNDGGLMQRLLEPSDQAPAYRRIEPGFPDQSYLYLKTLPDFPTRRVGAGNPMPPPGAGTLTPDQAGVLERWIASDAPE